MPFTPKVNTTGLFTNDRAPDKSDLTGSIEIACPKCNLTSHFWISGWRKTAKSGVKYLSLALRPKGAASEQAGHDAADESKIPF